MKVLKVIGLFLVILPSCQLGGSRGEKVMSHGSDEVRFLVPWQPEGGMSLYVHTEGDPQPVQESVRNFTLLGRGQFTKNGIPAKALIGATFLEMRDSREDLQAIYAIKDEEVIKVYRGYFVPGFGGPIEWTEVPLDDSGLPR